MASCIIGKPLTAGTITTDNEIAAFPVANLLRQHPCDVWRTDDSGAAQVTYNLGSAKTIIYAGLLYSNAASTTTIRVRGASTEANLTNGSAVYDSTVGNHWPRTQLEHWNRTHSFAFPGVSAQWWRIDLVYAGDYYQAGNLVLCEAWQGSSTARLGSSFQDIEVTSESTTETRFVGSGFRARKALADFKIQAAEEDAMQMVLEEQGQTKPIFYIENPTNTDRLMRRSAYGYADAVTTTRPHSGVYQISLTINEAERP